MAVPLLCCADTPEVARRKDAGGIFSSPQVPSQEDEPKGDVRLDGVLKQNLLPDTIQVGTPEGTRTPHLLLRRQLLYPDELLARMERVMGIEPTPTAWKAVVLAVILHPQLRVQHQL